MAYIPGVAVEGHIDLVLQLAVFHFAGIAEERSPLALIIHCLLNDRRQLRLKILPASERLKVRHQCTGRAGEFIGLP